MNDERERPANPVPSFPRFASRPFVHSSSFHVPRSSLLLLRLLFGDFLVDLRHVEGASLADDALQAFCRQRAGLGEEDHLLAQQHHVRDRADAERPRQLLLVIGVDLAEHDVLVLLGSRLEHRCEALARPAPRGLEIDNDHVVLGDRALEVVFRQLDRRHLEPSSIMNDE